MTKHYRFELTFSGLCVFTFKGADKRKPSEVNVLLVDTRHDHAHGEATPAPDPGLHFPFLSYDPRNVDGPAIPPYVLVPGPDGSQIALQDLTGRALEIDIPAAANIPLGALWRPADLAQLPEKPLLNDPSSEGWLDWAMALQRMNPDTVPNPDPMQQFGGLLVEKAIARARVLHGMLNARGFLHLQDSDYREWDFEIPSGSRRKPPEAQPSGSERTPDPAPRAREAGSEPLADGSAAVGPYAMAGSIVLTVYGIPVDQKVKLQDSGFGVVLQPILRDDGTPTDVVAASVTNLPRFEARPSEYLDHFLHFYDLVKFPAIRPELRLPKRRGGTITSGGSYCPPTTHTLADKKP